MATVKEKMNQKIFKSGEAYIPTKVSAEAAKGIDNAQTNENTKNTTENADNMKEDKDTVVIKKSANNSTKK